MSGLQIAIAKRLNAMLGRKGKVWGDRYHRRNLKTPTEVAIGFSYLFNNFTHHGESSYGVGVVDIFSSAILFDGWDRPPESVEESERWRWPICRRKTWLAAKGYLRAGRLPLLPRRQR